MDILVPYRTVHIPAQPSVITSLRYFEEVGIRYGVKESRTSNFRINFLDKEVSETLDVDLTLDLATEGIRVSLLLEELGDRAEISISQFCTFLSKGHRICRHFLCYLRGWDNRPRAVEARWTKFVEGPEGWEVEACTMADPCWTWKNCKVLSKAKVSS